MATVSSANTVTTPLNPIDSSNEPSTTPCNHKIEDPNSSSSSTTAMAEPVLDEDMEIDGDPQFSLKNSLSSESVNLESLSRDQLYEKIRRLQTHVKQLRNIILKRKISHLPKFDENCLQSTTPLPPAPPSSSGATPANPNAPPASKKKKLDRPFDFTTCPRRHVALRVAYLGWSYAGLAAQEDSEETIETHLFEALIKSKLIQSRATASYHRCGRTDKGVSAFSQVISIDLRCNATSGLGVVLPENWDAAGPVKTNEDQVKELQFCRMINRLLPRDIRVLAWAPVRPDFSARFDCTRRTYKYFFPNSPDLDLARMQTAAQSLVGDHDFRNFCKLETAQFRRARAARGAPEEKSTVRTVLSVEIDKVRECGSDLYVLTISGSSFVWHQIRCIVAILLLIGKGLEEPSLIGELLDVETNPKKPQYAMAVDFPLVLFSVEHGTEIREKDWIWEDLEFTLLSWQAIWVQHAVKGAMLTEMMEELKKQLDRQEEAKKNGDEGPGAPPRHPNADRWRTEPLNALIMGTKPKCYQKILDRPICERS